MQKFIDQNKAIPYGYFVKIIIVAIIAVLIVEFFTAIFVAGMAGGTGAPSWSLIPISILYISPFAVFVIASAIFWSHNKGLEVKRRLSFSIIIVAVPVFVVLLMMLLGSQILRFSEMKQEKDIANLYSRYENKNLEFHSWTASVNNILVEPDKNNPSITVATLELFLPPLPLDGEYFVKLDFIDSKGNIHQYSDFDGIRVIQQGSQISVKPYQELIKQIDSNKWQVNKEPLGKSYGFMDEVNNYSITQVKFTLYPQWSDDSAFNQLRELKLFEKSFPLKINK